MSHDVVVAVAEPGADDARLERLSLQLREELIEAGVGKVGRHVTGDAPDGTRAFEFAAAGALLLSAAGSLGTISRIVDTIRDWLGRSNGAREVEVTLGDKHLKLSASSRAEQEELVRAFLTAVSQETQA